MEGVPLLSWATYPCRLGRCREPKMGHQGAASTLTFDGEHPGRFEFVDA